MAHPIDVKAFRAASEHDREVVKAFFEGNDDLDLDVTFVVQVVAGGLKVSEYLHDQDGKRFIVDGTDEMASETRFVKVGLPYEVARVLRDMSERAARS